MISGVQILSIFFGLIMIYFTFLYFRKKSLNQKDFLLWLIIWIGFTLSASFPSTLTFLLQPLVIQSVIDLLTVGAFIIIFTIIFTLFVKVRKSEESIKNIVRKIAKD